MISNPKSQLNELLSSDPHINLNYIVIYLGPGDYHRFHSPTDFKILTSKHYPGELLSVSPKIVKFIPNLYMINERVVLEGKWKDDLYFGFVAVGATNVGSIVINFDEEIKTNISRKGMKKRSKKNVKFDIKEQDNNNLNLNLKNYDDINIKKGEELGSFKFGSTVILIFENDDKKSRIIHKKGDRILVGEAILNNK